MASWVEEQILDIKKTRSVVTDDEKDKFEKELLNQFPEACKELAHKAMKIVGKVQASASIEK